MASISKDKDGTRRILFKRSDGKRLSIRLGKMPLRMCKTVKHYVEDLASAAIANATPSDETARWVRGLDDELYGKLSRVGLLPERDRATLAAFLEKYISGRTDVKHTTQLKYESTRKKLVAFFGSDKPLREITQGCADEFRLNVASMVKAENTVRKHVAVAKLFFGAAKKRRLITENPFVGQASAIRPNRERFYFVTHEEAAKVLEACPDVEWRLIFALSRYGGLRCPSEHLGLRWQDIDWATGRLTIHSPKTEHHAGHESRVFPLFPELREILEDAFDMAEEGAEYVITRYRETNVNLRTQLERIIKRAGVQQWPKLFQNLRSTRQTELEEVFPSHVVNRWLGNSRPVAERHYLQVTDAHFERANAFRGVAKSPAHNPAHSMVTSGHNSSHGVFGNTVNAVMCDEVVRGENAKIAGAGLEPVSLTDSCTNDLGETSNPSGAKSGAFRAANDDSEHPSDARLAKLISLWPSLSEDVRDELLRISESELESSNSGRHVAVR